MWRTVYDLSGSELTINQEQIAVINQDDEGRAVLMMSDGSTVRTDKDRDALLRTWGIAPSEGCSRY